MGTDVVEMPQTALGTKTYFIVLILLSVTVHTLPKFAQRNGLFVDVGMGWERVQT